MKFPTSFGKKKSISIIIFIFVIFLCIAFSEYINYFMDSSFQMLEIKYKEQLTNIREGLTNKISN